MGKEKEKTDEFTCPVGKFFSELDSLGKKSEFFGHVKNSKIEFLKAIRCLVDDRIEDLEKKGGKSRKRRSTKIDVE